MGRRRVAEAAGRRRLPGPSATGPTPAPRPGILALQRSAGNRAVSSLLAAREPPVQRDDQEPAPGQAAGGGLLSGRLWLRDPESFLQSKPSLRPPGGLPLLPPSQVEGMIDWGQLGTAFRGRRLVLEDRDRSVIVEHWQRWYPVAQALYGLPGAKKLFDTPAAIMNTMSAKMIDSSLAGDRPDPIERFNRQAEQFGVSTTTVAVDVLTF